MDRGDEKFKTVLLGKSIQVHSMDDRSKHFILILIRTSHIRNTLESTEQRIEKNPSTMARVNKI